MLTFGLYAWQLILYTTGIDDVVVRYYKVYDWIPLTLKRLQRESTTIMEWLSEHYAIVMLML